MALALLLLSSSEKSLGVFGVFVVGLLVLAGFAIVIRYLWRLLNYTSDRLDEQIRIELRTTYRGIYRVLAPPLDTKNSWSIEGINIGDFGWEAQPLCDNGLIYLQGLTLQWGLAWHAGFRPDQIEYVTTKPLSQYDWKDFDYPGPKPRAYYHWKYLKPKNPCPFAVQLKKQYDLSFPLAL